MALVCIYGGCVCVCVYEYICICLYVCVSFFFFANLYAVGKLCPHRANRSFYTHTCTIICSYWTQKTHTNTPFRPLSGRVEQQRHFCLWICAVMPLYACKLYVHVCVYLLSVLIYFTPDCRFMCPAVAATPHDLQSSCASVNTSAIHTCIYVHII